MKTIELPFNKFVGIINSTRASYLLSLPDKEEYKNHLNTIHASALFALAEASSGQFLQNNFSNIPDTIAVVHKVETQYKKPAMGAIYSKAGLKEGSVADALQELTQKGHLLLQIKVTLHNEEGKVVMQSIFEWFLTERAVLF